MRYLKLGASALALALGMTGGARADEDLSTWRLFVSDHGKPVVSVIDAMDGDLIESFPMKGPATLYRSESGKTVFAVQGDADTVTTIASGIALEDHGDHADIDVEPPRMTGAEFTGGKPAHFVEHDGQIAVFFDKEGRAGVFGEREALDGKAEARDVRAAAPHHGVVVPFGQHLLVSVPNPDDPSKAPVGLQVQDRDGNPVGDVIKCVGLHGEATSGNLVAIGGCEDGILIVQEGDQGPEIAALPFPGDLKEGRTSTLVGGRGLQYFMGNHRPDSIVLIDPTDEPVFRSIALPARRVHFAADPVRPRFAWVLTEDGQLHRIDVLGGKIDRSVGVTDPYSMDGHWSDPRPRVAIAGDSVFITDPLAGRIHRLDAETLEKGEDITVEGAPFNIVAVGGSGVSHDHGDGHAHSHDHDHGDLSVQQGYFEDGQVQERTLADWQGDWQSVYPYLADGTLDPVMEHKAEHGDMTAEEYRAYYETGYRTEVGRIVIDGDRFTFYDGEGKVSGEYTSDGYEILTYAKGNRGVRYIFKKTSGDEAAPEYVQFSDHAIAPQRAGHYHLYWGDDRDALLNEVTNWPTYYPSDLSSEQIVSEMMAH